MRRVAITGTGVVSPIGIGKQAFFESAVAAASGIRPLQLPDLDRLGSRIAGQIRDFDPSTHFPRDRIGQLDRFSQFALVAAREAWHEASLPGSNLARCGVYFGTGLGGAGTLEDGYDLLYRRNQNRVRPLSVIATMPNAAAANMGIEFGLRGPCYTYAVACASSAIAIGEAYRAISAGWIDAAVAGGAEALLRFGILKGWEALMTLATEDASAPETSCKPFSKNRTGFVLGEGAGVLVLEDLEGARARGARIIAELVGYGTSNDASHLSRPNAHGQAAAISSALEDATMHGIHPSDIGYINAHGTATLAGDRTEVESIQIAFGEIASRIPLSSTKAIHGHLMGAGGAIEFLCAVLALGKGLIPPTAHLLEADPELPLDFVPNKARAAPDLKAVMSNSFAFGGENAVLVAASPNVPE